VLPMDLISLPRRQRPAVLGIVRTCELLAGSNRLCTTLLVLDGWRATLGSYGTDCDECIYAGTSRRIMPMAMSGAQQKTDGDEKVAVGERRSFFLGSWLCPVEEGGSPIDEAFRSDGTPTADHRSVQHRPRIYWDAAMRVLRPRSNYRPSLHASSQRWSLAPKPHATSI